jgi:hypothetical protein
MTSKVDQEQEEIKKKMESDLIKVNRRKLNMSSKVGSNSVRDLLSDKIG